MTPTSRESCTLYTRLIDRLLPSHSLHLLSHDRYSKVKAASAAVKKYTPKYIVVTRTGTKSTRTSIYIFWTTPELPRYKPETKTGEGFIATQRGGQSLARPSAERVERYVEVQQAKPVPARPHGGDNGLSAVTAQLAPGQTEASKARRGLQGRYYGSCSFPFVLFCFCVKQKKLVTSQAGRGVRVIGDGRGGDGGGLL